MTVGKRNLVMIARCDIYAILGLLCVLAWISCGPEGDKPAQLTEEMPQQVLQKFSTRHTEAGITRWTLAADKAEFHKNVGYMTNLTVQIFKDGQLEITITGDRGELIQASNDISFFDNVVGTSVDGILYTDVLHWRNNEGKLYGPNTCRIVRGDSTMIGRELEGNPSLETVSMKETQFRIYPKDEKTHVSQP